MHYDEHKKYKEIICFMIFVSSFISFNALGFNRHSAPDLGINLPIALTQYLQNDLLVSC